MEAILPNQYVVLQEFNICIESSTIFVATRFTLKQMDDLNKLTTRYTRFRIGDNGKLHNMAVINNISSEGFLQYYCSTSSSQKQTVSLYWEGRTCLCVKKPVVRAFLLPV